MLICINRETKRIIEMQSGAIPGTLIQNAVNAGFAPQEIEEREVDEAGYAAALAEDPVEIAALAARAAEAAAQEVKIQAFLDNLPSWAAVSRAVDNISNLAGAKVYLKKLSRVVYWIARDKAD